MVKVDHRKKILLLIPGFLCDTYSSVEEMAFQLTESLNKKWNVIWLVPSIDNIYNEFKDVENKKKLKEPLFVSELERRGLNYIVGNISKFNVVKNLFLFRRVFKDYKVNTVIVNFGFERFYGAFFGKLFRKKVIWYEHWFSLGTKFIFFKRIFYKIFIDYFITVSNFIGETLPYNKNVYVVNNALDIKISRELNNSEKNSLKSRLGLNKFEHIVLMVAAFRPEKKHDFAIRIAEKVLENNKKIGFLFLGDGPLRMKYFEEVKNKKLDDFIIMPGHKLNVPDYLSIADILILTSFMEPFGCCLLEAMMYKLPIVAFDSGGPREIVENNITGYLVPYGDTDKFSHAILELVSDETKRRQMGELGFERLKNEFNIEIWRNKISSIFDTIFDRS